MANKIPKLSNSFVQTQSPIKKRKSNLDSTQPSVDETTDTVARRSLDNAPPPFLVGNMHFYYIKKLVNEIGAELFGSALWLHYYKMEIGELSLSETTLRGLVDYKLYHMVLIPGSVNGNQYSFSMLHNLHKEIGGEILQDKRCIPQLIIDQHVEIDLMCKLEVPSKEMPYWLMMPKNAIDITILPTDINNQPLLPEGCTNLTTLEAATFLMTYYTFKSEPLPAFGKGMYIITSNKTSQGQYIVVGNAHNGSLTVTDRPTALEQGGTILYNFGRKFGY